MTSKKRLLSLILCACALLFAVPLWTQTFAEEHIPSASNIVWTAENSDPKILHWMQGSPPPDDKIIRFEDNSFAQFPQWRWTVCNFQQLMPTQMVSRGLSPVIPLESARVDGIDEVTFVPLGSTDPMTWKESLAANFTDGMLVMHHGKIVYETYTGCLEPAKRHGIMSMTKSITGLLGEILVTEGVLDDTALVRDMIPEIGDSAFATATVRQVMDMTTGVAYSEDYADPQADIWLYSAAASPL
ncbi:MAG: serine hydrolase domain-containing protein, partial [Pseudomonadota bacterium]